MDEQMNVSVMADSNNNGENSSTARSLVIGIYPLNCYYFGSKDPLPFRHESLADRVQRMKSNYDAHGLRTCVEAVLLVELSKQPHLLALQIRNSIFVLPGGHIRPRESDVGGLKRKLSRKLSANEDESAWEIPALMLQECIKLYLVKLTASRKFMVPKSLKLLAVPLCQVLGNHKTYGPVISAVPQLLSKFTFNIVNS